MNTVKQATGDNLRLLYEGGVRQVTVAGAVEAFLRAEGAESDWSSYTRTWYSNYLGQMARALGEVRPLSDLLEVDLREWAVSLRERSTVYGGRSSRPEADGQLSPHTIHGMVRAAKRFFRWLVEVGALPVDLAAGLKLPRLPKQLRKGISDENAERILAAARENCRDWALINFIESTGVRRGGVEDLRLSDLNLEAVSGRLAQRSTVREKGEKERAVVMSGEAVEALRAWLSGRPEIGDDHVFLGQSPGQPWHPLTETGISEIFDRYKVRLGLSGPCSPHQWRHRWFRNNLEDGMPIGHASQLGGHSDIKITHDYYGGFSLDELQDSYNRHRRKRPE